MAVSPGLLGSSRQIADCLGLFVGNRTDICITRPAALETKHCVLSSGCARPSNASACLGGSRRPAGIYPHPGLSYLCSSQDTAVLGDMTSNPGVEGQLGTNWGFSAPAILCHTGMKIQ